MTTAQAIARQIEGASAVTLGGGYAMALAQGNRWHRVTFEPARITEERRNVKGRCTHLRATYKDGSALVFTYSEARGARYRIA